MTTMASQITSLMVLYSIVDSGKLRVIGLCAGNSPVTVRTSIRRQAIMSSNTGLLLIGLFRRSHT